MHGACRCDLHAQRIVLVILPLRQLRPALQTAALWLNAPPCAASSEECWMGCRICTPAQHVRHITCCCCAGAHTAAARVGRHQPAGCTHPRAAPGSGGIGPQMPATTGWGRENCKEAHQQLARCVSFRLGRRQADHTTGPLTQLSSMVDHKGRQHAQQAQRAHQTANWRPSTVTASGLVQCR